MRLQIKGLGEWRERLASAQVEAAAARTLADGAARIADAVRDNLADPPGAGDHDRPWRRTGALHDSIEVTAEGLSAAVGSNDPAAAPQELGTARLPPRPFFAPVAAVSGEPLARSVGAAVAATLKGETAEPTVVLAGNGG